METISKYCRSIYYRKGVVAHKGNQCHKNLIYPLLKFETCIFPVFFVDSIIMSEIPTHIVRDLQKLDSRYLVKIIFFILIYILSVLIVLCFISVFKNSGLVFAIPFYILAGASMHGICLFTHEGVHGTIHRNILVNNFIGSISGYIVLQTMAGYRVLHLKHHKHLNMDGDPGLLQTYTSNKFIIAAMEWGYLLFGYIAFLSIIPYQGLKQGTKKDKLLIIKDLFFIVLFLYFILFLLPPHWFLHCWLIPMVFVHFMMNIRGMSQHLMLEDHHDPYLGARTIKAHPIVDFFLCNENYHIEHHLYPSIPWYNLKKVHLHIERNLFEKQSIIIFSFKQFLKEFVNKSFKEIRA